MQTTVQKGNAGQGFLKSRESVSVSAEMRAQLGAVEGTQVRITNRRTGRTGAYTVREIHDDAAPVRMSKRGRAQLDAEPGFDAKVGTTVPRTDLSFQDAWRADECVETVWHDPDADPSVAFIAPHGGDAERNTDQSAAFAAKAYGLADCSAWMVHNFGPQASGRWHITTPRIAAASYPGLQRLHGTDFERAVSFHLWGGDEIIVGGLADHAVRNALAGRIYEAVNEVREVVTEDAKYMGNTESNVVNWLTEDDRSGIQIEAPAYVCQRYRKRLGEAVAAFLRDESARPA